MSCALAEGFAQHFSRWAIEMTPLRLISSISWEEGCADRSSLSYVGRMQKRASWYYHCRERDVRQYLIDFSFLLKMKISVAIISDSL